MQSVAQTAGPTVYWTVEQRVACLAKQTADPWVHLMVLLTAVQWAAHWADLMVRLMASQMVAQMVDTTEYWTDYQSVG